MIHILLSFLFYNLILLIVYLHYKRGEYYVKKSHLFLYTILLIAFATYGTGEGDYLHYKESVEMFHSLVDVVYYNGMEIQYNYLAYLVDGNYTLWRLILFSVQFIGMSWLLYRSKLNTYPVLFCFIIICLVLYTYQRSYWGVIFYFLGLFLLYEKKNPLFLFIIALCYLSHTQNVVLLVLLPLSFIDIKKRELLLAILLMGTIASIFKDYFTLILERGGIEGADYINSKMTTYSENELGNFGNSVGEKVIYILRYVPVVLIVFGFVRIIFKERKKYLSYYNPYRKVINVFMGVVLAALIVLLADLGGGTFFYRIASMSFFPCAILLPYLLITKTIKKKTYRMYVLIFVVASELNYVKDIYYALAHGASLY